MKSRLGHFSASRFSFFSSFLFLLIACFWFTAAAVAADGSTAEPAAAPAPAAPAENTGDTPSLEQIVHERYQVIGSRETAAKEPGSAFYISKQELEKQGYADIHRILRSLPGVNIQEEDGLGLRPNIGMRGTGVERSQKITLMEDGVLIAPAPYTAPAAYYFPTAWRMETFEVLKGSASIKNGPYTNGGVLNMISSSIPAEFGVNLQAQGGSHGNRQFRAQVGDSRERFGYLVEGLNINSDGFKDLDNGGDTGTELKDYMAKLRFNSAADAAVYQSLELKLGKTEQFGNETYLGLTQADFDATPYRRYAASQNDHIDTDHDQYQLRYFVKPSDNFDITTTVYRNEFFRNWHKAERTRGVSNGTILSDPETYATELAILRGEIDSAPGDIQIRNNRRSYEAQGIQTKLFWTLNGETVNQTIEAGLRYHEDEEDRLQDDEFLQMVGGNLVTTRLGAPGSATNRFTNAEAVSAFIQDTIAFGAWTIRPGLRYETIDYERQDYSTTDPTRAEGPTRVRQNDVSVFVPGLGVDYQLNAENRAFVGIHRGFSPPGAGSNQDTEEERSVNYELGFRHTGQNTRFEAIGFFNKYSNLLGTETLSGGGGTTGDLFNGGEVDIRGLELVANHDFGSALGEGWRLPLSLVYTYTETEFQSAFETDFSDWSPRVEIGDELPYLPEQQYTLGFGLGRDAWQINLSGNYVGEMRTNAGQGAIPTNERIEDRFVVDLAGDYAFMDRYKITARLRNLTDETYLVSRRPYGARPGLDRTLLIGVSAKF